MQMLSVADLRVYAISDSGFALFIEDPNSAGMESRGRKRLNPWPRARGFSFGTRKVQLLRMCVQ